ncbi:MAG: peptidase A8 [Bacteroidetes bacterium]|jgi:signal peptidase II|nr:peptidase A8 [Bacteroidota bacterium]
MRVLWITAVVVGLDQLAKAAVLHFMVRQQSIPILGDWLKFTFTENPGMAFGIQLGTRGLVTFLALAATLLVIYYMYQVRNGYTPYRASLSLILGGAIGNIIDRVFYGVLLGYDGLFFGKVVDFIHVSLWRGFVPEFVPGLGGAYMELFPIWNVADMAIVLGVVGVLYFQNTFHRQLYEEQLAQMEDDPPVPESAEARTADGDGSTSPLTSLSPSERSTLQGPSSEDA